MWEKHWHKRKSGLFLHLNNVFSLGNDLDTWWQELFFVSVYSSSAATCLWAQLFFLWIILDQRYPDTKSCFYIKICSTSGTQDPLESLSQRPSIIQSKGKKKNYPTQLTYVLLNIKSKMKFLSPASKPYKTVCHLIKKTIPFKNFKVVGNLFFKEFHHRNQWVSFWNFLLSLKKMLRLSKLMAWPLQEC